MEVELCLAVMLLYCFLGYMFFANLIRKRISDMLIQIAYFKWNRTSPIEWQRIQHLMYREADWRHWQAIAIRALCSRDEKAVVDILYGTAHARR